MMAVGFEIPVVSFIFLLILSFVYFLRPRIKLVENKCFIIILICSLMATFFNTIIHLISSVTDFETFNTQWYPLIDFLNKFISVQFIIIYLFLFIYILVISYESVKNNFKKVVTLSIVFVALCSIVLFFTSIELMEVGFVRNARGATLYFAYAIVGILLFLSLIYTLVNVKRSIRKMDKRYLIIFFVIILMGLFFPLTYFVPSLIIYDLVLALLCYIMFFTMENPDMKMLKMMELAKDQAEKANLAKSDFLASMSHEIRTPLNAIVGYSDETVDSVEEARENAMEAKKAADILLEIITGVLDISKIESGSMEISNSEYNPVELFNAVCKMISAKVKERNLNFKINVAPDIPMTLYGDKVNIQKIIMNLLSNAVKYTKVGDIDFNVQCINRNDICSLIIAVEDSGRGIKPEDIHKLFKRFKRLEEDRNTTTEGTGLGLAISKNLVEMMGGKITVQSVYGKGSKFTISLNQEIRNAAPNSVEVYCASHLRSSDESDMLLKPEDIMPTNFKGKTVLLVDDNNLNLRIAEKLLRKYDIDVVCSISAFEGIKRIEKGENYDLLLLDDMMPKMTGTEMMQQLLKSGYTVPMVVLTANAMVGEREKYLEAGFLDYLEKPIQREELDRILNRFLLPVTGISASKNSADEVEQNETNSVMPDVSRFGPLPKELFEFKDEIDVEPIRDIDSGDKTLDKSNTKDVNYLKRYGANLSQALELLGDMEMYNETMEIFYEDIEGRLTRIKKFQENHDMKNYAVEAHSLKSDLRYLGFYDLGELSCKHETESKADNLQYILDNFDELYEEMKKFMEICKEYLGK